MGLAMFFPPSFESGAVTYLTPKVLANQPRVELWQPCDHEWHLVGTRNPEKVAPAARKPSQSLQDCDKKNYWSLSPGLPKLNHGLKFANTFGVTLRRN
jgi:hypothetical protein